MTREPQRRNPAQEADRISGGASTAWWIGGVVVVTFAAAVALGLFRVWSPAQSLVVFTLLDAWTRTPRSDAARVEATTP